MKKSFKTGLLALALFVIWTVLILWVDVRCIGETKTAVGLATLNGWFHRFIGVHLWLYTVTDWLGLVPICVCLMFGGVGFVQMLKRKSLRKVDLDLLLLGGYYVIVIFGYLVFEMIPINYRPILIEGRMEASYPSSTTLLVLCVMPTLVFQVNRRLKAVWSRKWIRILTELFSAFMVIGRLLSGVHWLSDIVGAVLLSVGLFYLYCAICSKEEC